jgi:phosphatidylserine decarboxylase
VSVATFAAAQLLRVLPRSSLSHAVGKLSERPLSPAVSRAGTAAYIRAFRVDMTDVDQDIAPYRSFDAFFTRDLRSGSRVVSSEDVVSPADGLLVDSGSIDSRSEFLVKGKPYDLGELIGDEGEARGLAGGAFAVVYLSPRDYHRVHSPIDGHLRRVNGISGDLYPVNAIGERHVQGLFLKNQRVAMFLDTKAGGRAVVVMVGAMIVGKITVRAVVSSGTPLGNHQLDPAEPVRRGDEIGTFHLGSTVVVLLSPGTVLRRRPGRVLYGQSLISP